MGEMNRFRAAVGEVAQQSAMLESVVAITVWGLAGLDHTVARIVVPNNMERMLTLIGQLLPVRVDDADLRQEVQTWVTEVRRLYKERGSILHSVWIGNGDSGPHWRADIKPLRDELDYKTPEELASLAAEMEQLSTSRASFLSRLSETVDGPWSVR